MNTYKATTTLATLLAIAAPAYASPAPLTPQPVVGAQVQILQNGVPTNPTLPVLYEKGTPQTIELRIDGFAFERYDNKPHPVAGHALEACIYPEAAYADKKLSPDEARLCYELPHVVFRDGPTVINSTFSNGAEPNPNQIEYPRTTVIDPRTNARPNLPVGSYLVVTSGEIDGNPVGRDQMYAARFKVLDAVPQAVEVKNIFADRGMELAYARHEPRPGTHVTLQSDAPDQVPVFYIPHKWDVAFLPTLEEWEVKGMGYREEYLLMDGIVNTTIVGVGGRTDMLERALGGAIDREDPRIVRYLPGQSQEFLFLGEFPASGWNTFWRGGDAGIAKAVVGPSPQLKTQPTDLAQIIRMTTVDEHGRPEWDNVGTLLHVAYDKENHIIGWQQAYVVTTPKVNSAAAPFIAGLVIGAGGMALIDYLVPLVVVPAAEAGTGGFGAAGALVQ